MSSVWPYHRRKKQNVLPCVTSLPAGARRGYLWRLSERRLLHNSSWKTKYFVLHQDKLYYYTSTRGKPGGVIDLAQFTDCLEAPLSDQKKANNVFFLLSEERGYFDKGRYYLSAETLAEMKSWVTELKGAIVKARDSVDGGFKADEKNVYSNIRESPLQSRLSPVRGVKRTLQSPLAGELEDHNLTYSYSSSEEEDVSPPVRMSPRSPRSAQSSLRRLALTRGMEARVEAKTEAKTEARSEARSEPRDYGKYDDLVRMVKDVKTQSDSLASVFRKMEGDSLERSNCQWRSEGSQADNCLEQSVANLNTVIAKLETQAVQIIKEIQSTHCRVLKELAEAEKVKSDYLDIRQKTEDILVLLRLEEKNTKMNHISGELKHFQDIHSQTFPKLKVSKTGNQKSEYPEHNKVEILPSMFRTRDVSLERKLQIAEGDREQGGGQLQVCHQHYARPTFGVYCEETRLSHGNTFRHTRPGNYSQSLTTSPPTTI